MGGRSVMQPHLRLFGGCPKTVPILVLQHTSSRPQPGGIPSSENGQTKERSTDGSQMLDRFRAISPDLHFRSRRGESKRNHL